MNVVAKKLSEAIEHLSQIEPVFKLGDNHAWGHYRHAVEQINQVITALNQPERTQNYFETLAGALNEAFRRAFEDGAAFDDHEIQKFLETFGCVAYGQTVRNSVMPMKIKGKMNYSRAMTVVITRMESGKYELVSYIL